MFQAESCLTLGSLYSAKVIDTKDTGVDVVVDCEGKTVSCLIPTPRLTDHASLARVLLSSAQHCRVPQPGTPGMIRDSRPHCREPPASPVPDNYLAPPPWTAQHRLHGPVGFSGSHGTGFWTHGESRPDTQPRARRSYGPQPRHRHGTGKHEVAQLQASKSKRNSFP